MQNHNGQNIKRDILKILDDIYTDFFTNMLLNTRIFGNMNKIWWNKWKFLVGLGGGVLLPGVNDEEASK